MDPIDPNELDPTGELAARIAAQRVEYGTYTASQRIYAGSALAYDVGHPVPVSNVVQHGYWFNGQVGLNDGAEHPPEIAAEIAARLPADGDGSGTVLPEVPANSAANDDTERADG